MSGMDTVQNQLTHQEVEAILRKSNGPYILLELVRRGRIDAETAVTAIDRVERQPFFKRLFLAILDTLFSK